MNTTQYKQLSVRKIAVTGMVIAISIIMSVTVLGTIPLPAVEITIAHIPTIVLAILEGPVCGLISSIALGITSMAVNILMPKSPLAPYFANPLISILPRMFIGPVAYYVYAGIRKLLKNKKNGIGSAGIAAAVAGAAGSLTNTVLVLVMLYVVYAKSLFEAIESVPEMAGMTVVAFLWGIASLNGLWETIASIILTSILITALHQAGYGKIGGKRK